MKLYFQKLSFDIVNKKVNGEIIIKNEDEEKENEIKINDEQNSEKEIKEFAKKERKREKEKKCCL